MADIRDALEGLSINRKAARFVLVGLCSGADHALAFGHTDPRVAGLVLLDPWMPATPRHYIRYVAMRLPRPRAPSQRAYLAQPGDPAMAPRRAGCRAVRAAALGQSAARGAPPGEAWRRSIESRWITASGCWWY